MSFRASCPADLPLRGDCTKTRLEGRVFYCLKGGVRVPSCGARIVADMDPHDPMDALDPLDSQEEGRTESARRVEIDDLKRVMSNKAGRRFVADMLKRSAVDASSFDLNPHAMAFKEGVKWLGQRIIDDLKTHCPDRYIEMLKESLEHDRSDDRSARRA